MRSIIVSEYMALDGVIEAPMWTTPFWSDEIAKFKFDELFASDALLLGRVTYQGFAQAWPSMSDPQGFADRMNNLPKYVPSTTLDEATWNAELIKENVVAAINALKEQPGENILVYGSGKLVRTLLDNNLVDELHILLYPVVVGAGQRLFDEGSQPQGLTLTESRSFASGVVLLSYHPTASSAP